MRKINWGFSLGRLFGYNYIELKYSESFSQKKKKKFYYICEEIIFVPRGIIIFSQFIVNLGFEYNLSVVISILL